MIEQQYAGALVLQPELYWQHGVAPEDIQDADSRKVVEAVSEMLRANETVDVVTVAERTRLPMTVVGGLAHNCFSTTAAISAAKTIRENAMRRRAERAFQDAMESVRKGADPHHVIDDLMNQVERGGVSGAVDMRAAMVEAEQGEKAPRIRTQIPKLNDYVKMSGGKLITLAGRPGSFKSACMLHIASYAAHHGCPFGIISLEMLAREIGERYTKMGGKPDVPIYINDKAQALPDIEAQIIQWRHQQGIAAVAVDYLGLMHYEAPKQMRRDEVIGVMTRRLKLLAMRLDIPIIMLAQLNRENEKQGRRPILSDLRESGNIEQDSDVVLFLHRYERDGRDEFLMSIAKQRGGPTGLIDLYIDAPRFRVMEATR